MNYEEFRRLVETLLPQCLPEKYAGAEIGHVSKYITNGRRENKEGFSLGRITDEDTGASCSPVYFYDDLYREFSRENMDADRIGGWLQDKAARWFANGEQAVHEYAGLCSSLDPGRIYFSFINKAANIYYLAEVPHRNMMDFSVIYHYYFSMTEGGVANAVITYEMAERLGMTEPELYHTACANMPKLFPAKMEWLSEKLGHQHGMEGIGDILHITTSAGMYGPCTMFYRGMMNEISDKLGGDAYVMPVSIHELLAVRAQGFLKEPLTQMVRKLSKESVNPEERLSSAVYYYNVKEDTISFAAEMDEAEIDEPQLLTAREGKQAVEEDIGLAASRTVPKAPGK